jgi:galactokinase
MDTADKFAEAFGAEPEVRVRAPGRVNLLGEHTDYSGGLVLPLAIDRHLDALASRRRDGLMRIEAPMVSGSAEVSARSIPQAQKEHWLNYILGVAAELWTHGDFRDGFNLMIDGNLPSGAGLASSAALAVGTAYALSSLFKLGTTDLDLILAAQRAEHKYAGVQCGIMDQAASALSRKGHALLIDCRTLEMRPVPFGEPGLLVAVCHTGVKHALAESEYNRRVAECAEALAAVRQKRRGVACLGELASADRLELRASVSGAPAKRLDHVILENERVRAGSAFLEVGDLASFGKLMFASHGSLRDLYEVSCPELDAIVESARAQKDAVMGAKMTGAGFGGAVVCLVREEKAAAFEKRLAEDYLKATGRKVAVALCRSADGARESLTLKKS